MAPEDPQLATALLRVATTLKRAPEQSLDGVVAEISAEMHIDPITFRRYLADHMELLAKTASEGMVYPTGNR